MGSQAIIRTCRGLYTQYNPHHGAPEGALLEAQNAVVEREGRGTPRRGFARYGTTADFSSLFEYQNKLIGLAGSSLLYDSDGQGAWLSHPGYSPPDSATRMRSVQADLALLISSAEGPQSTDLITTAPARAGMPAGLDTQISLSGTGLGWFLVDTQVAYRIVWGRIDKNNRLKLGAPSMRKVATNASTPVTMTRVTTTVTVTHTAHGYSNGDTITFSSISDAAYTPNSTITVVNANSYTYTIPVDTGGASATGTVGKKLNATLTFTVPKRVVEGDFYEVYRTPLSAGVAVDPGDLSKRVARVVVVAGDITARDTANVGVPITFSDSNDPAFLGEQLYTNSTRDGIARANSTPPWAKDIVLWKDHLWYLNTRREELVEIQLIDVTGLVDDTSSVTITIGATAHTYTFSAAEDIGNRKFKRFTAGSTLAQNIRDTMESLIKCVNRDNDQALFYAYYVSGITDPPGAIAIECRAVSTARMYMTCNNSTTGSKFSTVLPTSGTLFSSDNETIPNGLYRSKVREYEAVPEGILDEIGDPSKEALRAIPLKDSLIIVKRDGIWRVTGESERTFSIKPLETTVFGRAPATWVSFDNAAWGLSTQGLVRITESGSENIGRPIDDKFAALLSFPNMETLTHAVAYESEGLYVIACQEAAADTKATVMWAYNNTTQAWTGPWRKPVKCGHVLFTADRLFLAHGDDAFLLRDRKAYDLTDYTDEELACIITALGTTTFKGETRSLVTVSFSYSMKPEEGWLIQSFPQMLAPSRIDAVDNTQPDVYVLTLSEHFPGLQLSQARLFIAIESRLVWVPEDAGSLGVLKHFTFLQAYLAGGNATRARLGFETDITPARAITEDLEVLSAAGSAPVRSPVPTTHQRGRSLTPVFEHSIGREFYHLDQLTVSLRQTSEASQAVPR